MVSVFLVKAADYDCLWKGRAPRARDVDEVFTSAPPARDPGRSNRLGLLKDADLVGVATPSFGFPAEGGAYLGLMILAPRTRSRGLGKRFLAEVAVLARQQGAPALYPAVLEHNPRGQVFWARTGFAPTGVKCDVVENGRRHRLFRLKKPL